MKITKRRLNRILINCVLALIATVYYFATVDTTEKFLGLSAISIACFAVILLTNTEPLASPYTIFVIVLFVYNCGQVWLNLFGVPIIPGNYTITRFSDDLLADSMFFFTLMMLSMNIFFIQSVNVRKKRTLAAQENGADESVCLILFWVLLFFCLIYDYGQYRIASTSGYAAALYARSNNELMYMFNCAFPFSVFLALRSNIKVKQKIMVALLSGLRYVATTIFIGYRMQAISFVLALIVLFYGIVEEKDKKKISVLMVAGVFAAALLSVFAANLRRGLNSAGLFEAYNSLIQELGGTFIDLPIIISDIDDIGAAYGLSYVCAVLYLIPFIGHIVPGMSRYVNLSAILYTRIKIYGDSSLGGSMLAEFFYNFKWWAIILAAPAVGWGFAKICNALNEKINKPFESAMLAYIFYIFLLFSRGNIGEVTIYIRCAVYIYVLKQLLGNRKIVIGKRGR